MLSIGCVRAKFAKHIAMLILVDACASGFGFYLFGCGHIIMCSSYGTVVCFARKLRRIIAAYFWNNLAGVFAIVPAEVETTLSYDMPS